MKLRFLSLIWVALFVLSGCGSDVYDGVGARCHADRDCPAPGRCLQGSDFPGGFCSFSCNHSGQCPSGTECIDKKGGACLFQCDGNADCPGGWECSREKLREHGGVRVRVCIGR